jgi:hypothetical protein
VVEIDSVDAALPPAVTLTLEIESEHVGWDWMVAVPV